MRQDSWLYSDSFLKRCFAIWGHCMVAHLIIMVPFALLWLFVIVMVMKSFLSNSNMFPPAMQQPAGVQMDVQ